MVFFGILLKVLGIALGAACAAGCIWVFPEAENPVIPACVLGCAALAALGAWGSGIALGKIRRLTRQAERLEQQLAALSRTAAVPERQQELPRQQEALPRQQDPRLAEYLASSPRYAAAASHRPASRPVPLPDPAAEPRAGIPWKWVFAFLAALILACALGGGMAYYLAGM